MWKKNKIIVFLIWGIYLPFHSFGQQKPSSVFWLFHPVPQGQMREMETDRPDLTESPFTVDAGHLQYETDLVRMTRERSDVKQTNTFLINQANLKLGISRSTAIQIGLQSFGRQQEKDLSSGQRTTTFGIGDVTLRIKQNLVGNDGGNFAIVVLPYVKFPTSKYDDKSRFEGGLIVPMQFKLSGEWKLGLQVEADRLKDPEQQTMHTELLQSLTMSHELIKGLDGIAETYYTYDFKAHQWSNFLNAAVQLDVSKEVKLDAGLNYGIQPCVQTLLCWCFMPILKKYNKERSMII